jgi:hypothetical protein
MADARILFPEFRDEQSDSRYPFVDNATLRSDDGAVTIANNAFIDASFFGIDLGSRLYISQISVTPQTVTVFVGDAASPTRLRAVYDPAVGPENSVLSFFDDLGRPAGMLLSDPLNLSKFNTWFPGNYTFSINATEFVSTVVIPANAPGVRGINFDSTFIYGDMWLVGNAGVLVRKEEGTASTIRIDVIGEPLFNRFVCEPLGDFPAKPYLKTINGCGPDRFGNFTITATAKDVADPVLRVTPQNNALVISVIGRSPI